jgi:hypothetical protein
VFRRPSASPKISRWAVFDIASTRDPQTGFAILPVLTLSSTALAFHKTVFARIRMAFI